MDNTLDTDRALDALANRDRRARLARDNTAALRRRIQARLWDDVADAGADCYEPGGLLAQIAAGYDPRCRRSLIGSILDAVRARGPGALPSSGEWAELADALDASPLVRGQPVDIDLSARAAEKLLPYLYPRAGSEGSEGSADGAAVVVIAPLTTDEIESFEAHWRDDY